MFEKDAQYYAFDEVKHKQEWYIKHPERSIDEDYEDIKKHWGKGAEFGYNKANEWHYLKDGDLPEHEINVLVLFNKQCIDIAHYNYDYKEWHFTDSIVHDVIAWKEILLPKEG